MISALPLLLFAAGTPPATAAVLTPVAAPRSVSAPVNVAAAATILPSVKIDFSNLTANKRAANKHATDRQLGQHSGTGALMVEFY
ncbi:MAG: hypothetical protein KA252_01825 [Sphingorhabdus sp.]|nr:hypothetical protein [Sphingorhabdus sp.]